MAILEKSTIENIGGFKKSFAEGSEAILFDFIQQHQYQYPVQSAIRELVSNANDSIKEKKQFFLIDSGKKKVSDFYVEQEGELFKDSKYNPDYYDKRWLSRTRDDVSLVYKANNAAQRDSFHIIDTGVGLGGIRLEKHFNPLFSTKRNNTQQLGKFGVGSKAGLALDIDYYTLITRYNGLEFHFNVFNYKVDSIVPRFNLDKGIENEVYTCQTLKNEDGSPLQFYAYKTEEMNGVEVILQAKKGLKKDFIDAVKGQLLYMDGIKFTVIENGEPREEKVKAEIMYEDDVFVMPTKDSTYYSKPHIILGDVCYGYVDFLMLEEEARVGNIGMKIDPSKVDITVNRESVRWTEKTRNAIHETFKKGETIAERVMEQALNTEDLLDWLRKMQAWISTNDKDSIVGRFSNIIDVKNLRPTFKPIPTLGFHQVAKDFFSGMEMMKISSAMKYSKSRGYNFKTLERSDKVGWQELGTLPVYIGEKDYRKEMWLLTQVGEYVRLTPKEELLNDDIQELDEREAKLIRLPMKDIPTNELDEYKGVVKKAKALEQRKFYELFRNSHLIEFYSNVIVPEDFKLEGHGGKEGADEEEEEDAVVKEVVDSMSAEQRRKLEEKILVNTFDQGWTQSGQRDKKYPAVYRKPIDVKARTLLQDKAEVIYGFQEDEANLCLVAEIMGNWRPHQGSGELLCMGHESLYNDSLKIIMTSKANAKFLKPHLYVNDFFMSFNPETKTISMHNRLVKWQTARKVKAILTRLQFLKNFMIFDADATATFNNLCTYVATNDLNLKAYMTESKSNKEAAEEVVGNLESFADKITDLQLFIAKHPDDGKAIGAKCKALFETDEDSAFEGALGVEIEVYQQAIELDEATKEIQLLLNQVDALRRVTDIPYALEQEIRGYLAHKQYISLSVLQAQLQPEETVTEEALTLNS